MLLEFDADQQLWQDTVRDAVAKQCPASLVRSIAEGGADAAQVWKTYVAQGWTELVEPETAVELAIVLEELGRATDPTPYLATVTQFAPLAGARYDHGIAGPNPAGGDGAGIAAKAGVPPVRTPPISIRRGLSWNIASPCGTFSRPCARSAPN